MSLNASAHRWLARALGPLLAAVLGLVTLALSPWGGSASAHGTVVDPASRAYSCYIRWQDDFQDPAMQTEDPMCYQAWQANTNTMWNWMSLYQNDLGGQFQQKIPDGKLCSINDAQGGLGASLDTVGAWKTTDISSNFTIHLHDQASHGADYFIVYVSKNSYNPDTQPLGWGDLDQVTKTGSFAPATDYTFNVNTSGYTGHHVIYTIWQASHMDQAYLMCSDVNFG